MSRRNEKITRVTHIKKSTVGTSNELSFSVLDAAKNEIDEEKGVDGQEKRPLFGVISLFTLPGRKKAVATPTKAEGLHLSTGEFISVEDSETAHGVSATLGGAPSRGAGFVGGAGETGSFPGASSAQHGAIAGVGGYGDAQDSSAGASLWVSPEGEVKRRKNLRKRRRFAVYAALTFVLCAGLGVLGWWLYEGYTARQSQVEELHRALKMVEATDEQLIALDDAVSALLDLGDTAVPSEEETAAYGQVTANLTQAKSTLKATAALVRSAAEEMPESVDKEAANQAAADISARCAMIDAGRAVLIDATAASAAASSAEKAWELLLEGDGLAREAAQLVTNTTEENVRASIDKSNRAIDSFAQADGGFAAAATMYKEADFSSYRSYLAKRIEALGYAVASNEAFLVRDKEEAAAQNDAYNEADEEAASMAKGFSSSPSSVVAAASLAATEKERNDYVTARSQASSADAFLRDYLGTTSK